MKFNDQSTRNVNYKLLLILTIAAMPLLSPSLVFSKSSRSKINNTIQAPIKLTPGQLATFAGKYRFMDDYVIVTVVKGGISLTQLQGKRATINFYPTDLHEFHTNYFGKPYWIMFSGSIKNKAPSFLTSDRDIWTRVK